MGITGRRSGREPRGVHAQRNRDHRAGRWELAQGIQNGRAERVGRRDRRRRTPDGAALETKAPAFAPAVANEPVPGVGSVDERDAGPGETVRDHRGMDVDDRAFERRAIMPQVRRKPVLPRAARMDFVDHNRLVAGPAERGGELGNRSLHPSIARRRNGALTAANEHDAHETRCEPEDIRSPRERNPYGAGSLAGLVAHWLIKEEPTHYSFADLVSDGRTRWDGVHNPLALRHLRAMRRGDTAIYYHTGKERACVGIARVTTDPRPDPSDRRGSFLVDVEPVRALARAVTLAEIKADASFEGFDLVRIGRLSVMPVDEPRWQRILALSDST